MAVTVTVTAPLLYIQGGFFDWSALKMTLRKF